MSITADKLIGLPVYARRTVFLRRGPEDSAPVLRVVSPGQKVGVIKSWINQRPGSRTFYLEFDETFGTSYAAYDEALDRPTLKAAYDAREEEKRRQALGPNGRALEDAGNFVQETAATAGSGIMAGALVLGGVYIIGRLLISGK